MQQTLNDGFAGHRLRCACRLQRMGRGEQHVRLLFCGLIADADSDHHGSIMLYPQATKLGFSNPNGCWDWWGVTGSNYAVRTWPFSMRSPTQNELMCGG
jgi:hypothetical protein